MTIALSLTILVLIGISVWQIAKIFELSQSKKENTQVANDNDNRYNGQLMFAFLLFIYGITLYSFWKWGDVLLPEAASEHGSEYDNLMWISFAIIFFCTNNHTSLIALFFLQIPWEKRTKSIVLCRQRSLGGHLDHHSCNHFSGIDFIRSLHLDGYYECRRKRRSLGGRIVRAAV